MPKLTIKEIASIAGVSPSAVSIVLNERKGVSDKTRQNIKEIVERLEYIPNQNSRRLLFNKSNNIAVLSKKTLSPLDQLFYAELTRAIMHECENSGYNLMFTAMSINGNKVTLPNSIRSYDVDGTVIYGDVEPFILESLGSCGLPFIVVDCHSEIPGVQTVTADYSLAATTAVKLLLGLGHRKIAYLGNSSIPGFGRQTLAGYRQALEEAGIRPDASLIQTAADDENSAYLCTGTLLQPENFPTAIFCTADIYAFGAMRRIKDSGLSIPHDISVVGIDDIIVSSYTEPTLTTVKIDKQQMGKLAVEALIGKIDRGANESGQVKSDDLVIRKSAAPARR